jgi:hypothetical protein
VDVFEELARRGHVFEHMAADGGVECRIGRQRLETIRQLPHAGSGVIHTVHKKAL